MPKIVKSSAPVRIDFGGSTLDLTPLVPSFPANIVTNLAVSLRATVQCSRMKNGIFIEDASAEQTYEFNDLESLSEDKRLILFYKPLKSMDIRGGIKIGYKTGSPFGAGLGGSSALLIALLQGLHIFQTGGPLDDMELVEKAASIEKGIIGGPTGKQDYISAVKGGLNAIRFRGETIGIEPVPFDLDDLSKRLCVLFTGKPHFSGDNNFTIVNKVLNNDIGTIDGLKRLEESSTAVYSALKRMDFKEIISSIDEEMKIRMEVLPSFITPMIAELADYARRKGGALKVCGAGGGGSVFMIFKDKIPEDFRDSASALGALPLECRPDMNGLAYSQD